MWITRNLYVVFTYGFFLYGCPFVYDSSRNFSFFLRLQYDLYFGWLVCDDYQYKWIDVVCLFVYDQVRNLEQLRWKAEVTDI